MDSCHDCDSKIWLQHSNVSMLGASHLIGTTVAGTQAHGKPGSSP